MFDPKWANCKFWTDTFILYIHMSLLQDLWNIRGDKKSTSRAQSYPGLLLVGFALLNLDEPMEEGLKLETLSLLKHPGVALYAKNDLQYLVQYDMLSDQREWW